jgi:putative FmdB family regulatory protein
MHNFSFADFLRRLIIWHDVLQKYVTLCYHLYLYEKQRDQLTRRIENMPIYEFKCKKCGNVFEFLCFRSDDSDTVTCPSCGKSETEKLLSAFASCSCSSDSAFPSSAASSSCVPKGGFS